MVNVEGRVVAVEDVGEGLVRVHVRVTEERALSFTKTELAKMRERSGRALDVDPLTGVSVLTLLEVE